MANTFATIRTKVAESLWSEVDADDLLQADVDDAINDACGLIADKRDWLWKTTTGTINTVAGTGEYDLPSDFGFQIQVWYREGNDPCILTHKSEEEIIRQWDATETGQPVDYAIRRKSDDSAWEILIRPLPEQDRDVFVFHEKTFTDLSDDADTNYITNNLKRPLIACAASFLALDALQDEKLFIQKEKLYEKLIEEHETRDDKMKEDANDNTVHPDAFFYEGAFNGHNWNGIN